jgi:hypothetical protein
MIGGLVTFLLGALVLLVVLWVFDLVSAKMELPEDIRRIAKIIVGLIGLCVLVWLAMGAFGVGGAPRLFPL